MSYNLLHRTSSSSSCSVPLAGALLFPRFHAQSTVICSVPGRPQTQVLMFEVVLYCTQPRLSRTTARSSPVLRRVVDARVEGPKKNRCVNIAKRAWRLEHVLKIGRACTSSVIIDVCLRSQNVSQHFCNCAPVLVRRVTGLCPPSVPLFRTRKQKGRRETKIGVNAPPLQE